jgi:HK97 family phage prohead protease
VRLNITNIPKNLLNLEKESYLHENSNKVLKGGLNIVKDINIEKREVIFAFSKFNDYDSDNDITYQGAFSKTIKESGPEGANRIRHVWGHDKENVPIGSIKKLWEDSEFAYAHVKMLKNQKANDVFEAYKEEAINEHSYWGKSFNLTKNERGGYIIKEVKLYEISSVLWGASEHARLKQLIKGEVMGNDAIMELKEHLLSLDKFVKKSNGSDDFLYQLESEINKALDIILPISLERIQAVEKTPEDIKPKTELSLADLYKLKTFN